MQIFWPLRFTLTVSALAALAGITPAQGTPITDRRIVTYTDKDINMWGGSGQARGYLPPILIGPKIDVADQTIGAVGEIVTPEIDARPIFYIPSYRFGKTGAKLTFGGGVEMGLRVYPWLDRGTLAYKYVAGVDLTYSSLPVVNQETTVTARFVGCAGSSYSTTNPSIGMKMGAVAKVNGHADVDAWFLGSNLYTGSAFTPFNEGGETLFKPVTPIPGEDPDLLVKFDGNDVATRLNDFLRILNPTPIGAELAVPNLETRSTPISADGTLQARTFSKFLSVQTDLASWTIGLIPGPLGKALKAAVSGNYPVPATNYRVTWDFAKTYASLDVGLIAANSLRPSTTKPPAIKLVVYKAGTGVPGMPAVIIPSTTTVVNGVTTAKFVMPPGGVRIEPELDLTLEFRSRVAMGVGGEVGTEPIRVTAKGTLGYGTRIAPVDFDFSVGRYVWKPAPSEGVTFGSENKFDLRAPVEGRVRNMGAFGVNAFDGTNLPNEVYGRYGFPDPYPTLIPAYSYDSGGGNGNINQDVKTVSIRAQQGFSFFPGSGTTVTATLRPLGGEETFSLGGLTVQPNTIQVPIPTVRLRPGKYTLALQVNATNLSGTKVSAEYFVPLTAYNPQVSASPQVFTTSGLEPSSLTNRIVDDGQDSTLYLGGARGILNSTQVILDDTYVLPNNFAALDEIALANQSEARTVGLTISSALKAQLAGTTHTIKLRAPSLIRGGNGELLTPFESEPIPIFIVSGAPRIEGYTFNDVAGAKLAVTGDDRVIEIRGQNFSKATRIDAGLMFQDGIQLQTEYAAPGILRVTIPGSIFAMINDTTQPYLTLRATTPVVTVPRDAENGDTLSGGISDRFGIALAYPRPALNRVANPTSPDEGKITLRDQETRVRIYGDSLYARNGTNPGLITRFTLDGAAFEASRVSYPALASGALTVPYVDLTLPASSALGSRTIVATNPSTEPSSISVSNENPVPAILTVNGNNRIRIGASGPIGISVLGGAIYPGAGLLLNGVNLNGSYINSTTLGVTSSVNSLNAIPGKTAQAVLRNVAPGGGDSAPITVTLDEGNPATLTLVKGLLTYDRASNAWKQEITVRYGGSRNLDTARIYFQGLPSGVQLVNSNGTLGGLPFANVPMKGGATAKFVALFRVPAGTSVSYTASPAIP